ncbi:3-deoxy-D-manno-octulosonic acid transferase [Aquabacterium sp. A08]|uniref:3-deoxy-D-manno-octulosonic acid transferase n=1 Tax=Aquabacterium sp. A08 TaxID=2718532 RepID=UPI001422C428|nr:3-deoxy-D-manno-octulosonic acid transferase [Aquabacterium sp. A08]NIC43063.1 3-deoxy-D-manno-octulosonic acid transferase [Aquabacterium sp. A08]
METLALALYSAAVWAMQPLLRRKLRRRARQEPGYGVAVEERFGRYHVPPAPEVGWLWVHAVSLGETRAAALLLERLRQRWPDLRLLLTHSTATGRTEGEKLLRPGDTQVWLPWDTPGAVRRFYAHFRPCVGVLMETEVWPQLVRGARHAGVPLLLVNARLNARSQRRAQRLAWLSGPAYRGLTGVYAQTEDDAARLRSLGAVVRGVHGNLKFDVPWHPDPWATGRAWRAQLPAERPVIVWASAREGEEALWLETLRQHPWTGPQRPLWVVVPRHPQRFNGVAALLADHGWAVWRRSALASPAAALPEAALAADVWLGDTLGEMPLYLGLAHMGLLGGSYLPLGGQNLIEAAACGCPLVLGPHTFNFAEAAEAAVRLGAAVRVADLEAALRQLQAWVADGSSRLAAEAACQTLIAQGSGAAERCAQAVSVWFRAPAGR